MSDTPAADAWVLVRDDSGRLMLTVPGDADRGAVMVTPVRAFPITAPHGHVSLVDDDGQEQASIARLEALAAPVRELVEEGLAAREFMPVILRIEAVSRYITPCTWTVLTDRGQTDFILKAEEAIRRLPADKLLIADANGVQYLIPDREQLDDRSRKLLDRFM